jgi:alcohol dehydrogenase class IV
MAEEGIRALARSLPKLARNPDELEVRSDLLYGAWLSGASLGAVGMSIHHKLCHTLGGSFNLAHSEVHTVILPHAVAYNRDAAPEAMARIAGALGTHDAATGIWDLEQALGAPLSLKQIGMKAQDLDRAAQLATERPYYNPRPIALDAIRALLDDAFHGRKPTIRTTTA